MLEFDIKSILKIVVINHSFRYCSFVYLKLHKQKQMLSLLFMQTE